MTDRQTDPQRVRERFAGDASVTRFLQEFSRVMSVHFTDLHSQQRGSESLEDLSSQQQQQTLISSVTELGPLHTEVLARHKQQSYNNTNSVFREKEEEEEEERRAQVLLSDPAVREMLMDTCTQNMLLDCAHPDKLRMHLQDPAAASKIKQLIQLGLLRIAS